MKMKSRGLTPCKQGLVLPLQHQVRYGSQIRRRILIRRLWRRAGRRVPGAVALVRGIFAGRHKAYTGLASLRFRHKPCGISRANAHHMDVN